MPLKINFFGDLDVPQHIVSDPVDKKKLGQSPNILPKSVINGSPIKKVSKSKSTELSQVTDKEGDSSRGATKCNFQSPKNTKNILKDSNSKTQLPVIPKKGTPTRRASGTPKSRGKKKVQQSPSTPLTSDETVSPIEEGCRSKLAELSLLTDEGEDSLRGASMFHFQSPKNTKNMLLKAFDSASKTQLPVTPKKGTPTRRASGTPKSRGRGSSRKTTPAPLTPVTRLRKEAHGRSTPRKLHARNKSVIESDESSEEDSEESEEEEDEEAVGSQEEEETGKEHNLKSAVEEYFLLHGSSKGIRTSDRTLAKLGDSRPDPVTVRNLMDKMALPYAEEIEKLREGYGPSFDRWMLEMGEGFNILLFGVGSKRKVLEDFHSSHLAEEDCIIVPGYQPDITIRKIMRSISEFLQVQDTVRGLYEQARHVRDLYNDPDSDDLYLLVHNIDGPLLRNAKAQTALSTMAEAKHIHMVASVDHINAAMMWNHRQLGEFRWVWKNCTTMAPYTEETSFENSLLIHRGGGLALTSLRHVMASLTKNARDIFFMVARHQLDANEEAGYQGLSLEDLYWRCRDAFLVNSEVTLRTQLTEFRDHQLIKFKKGLDGVEMVLIPLDQATLREFVENIDEF